MSFGCSKKKQQTNRGLKKSETFVQDIIKNFEKLAQGSGSDSSPRDSPFSSTEEFIDDDYHSYTSSEELESLKKIEEYEFNEVCKAYKDMVLSKPSGSGTSNGSKNNSVEDVLLQKMDKLEQTMESVKQDFNNLNTQFQIEELERSRNKEQMKMENMKDILDKSMERYSHEHRLDIKDMIAKSIEYLNREFERKRIGILRDSEEKIRRLIDDIYMTSSLSGEDMKRLCKNTAATLTKRLDSTLKSMYKSLPEPESSSLMIEHGDAASEVKHECFNYENVCKVLSEQLQLTHEEKENLELENLDMTLKCSETQQAVSFETILFEQ